MTTIISRKSLSVRSLSHLSVLTASLKLIDSKRKTQSNLPCLTRLFSRSALLNSYGNNMSPAKPSLYILENSTPVTRPECKEAFDALDTKEKLYLHYLSKAAWFGSTITLFQSSSESPAIFLILDNYFRDNQDAFVPPNGVAEEDFAAFLVYAAGFYANSGNYKGFGDTKFVPGCSEETFEKILRNGKKFDLVEPIYNTVKQKIFSLSEMELNLGLGNDGVSSYFSSNCDRKDAELADKFMQANSVDAENTRLVKTLHSDSAASYQVVLASELESEMEDCKIREVEGSQFRVTRGDYSPLLGKVNMFLEKAIEHASNDTEKAMLRDYIESFKTGSLQKHKDGSLHWIRNKGPIVETYIGFIETYRDPYGTRAEWEGFVAIVNKPMSAKFATLVENAEKLLPCLPWPQEFEKDTFLRPDFTSLDVITFGGSGIPAGINIPNYDSIRQHEGFKNVSLGNIINAVAASEKITFVTPEDAQLFKDLKGPSFDIQVALHELLGHGSGKLLTAKDNPDQLINPVTGEKVHVWYQEGQTYDSVFQSIGSSYEECRAECVGLYLCGNHQVLEIFGHTPGTKETNDVIYVNWMSMARAGLLGMQFYDPTKKVWGQAHMQARFAILQVMLEAGEDFIKFSLISDADEKGDDILLTVDASKIESVGVPAIGKFLQKLNVYKAMADKKSAEEMYSFYTTPNETFLSYRDIVLSRKQPRKENVLPNTVLSTPDGSDVKLVEYEASQKGLIQSFVDRYNDDLSIIGDVESLWKKYSEVF